MTTAVSARVLPRVPEVSQPGHSPLWDIWLGLRRSPSGMIGLLIVTLHICLALAAPYVVPYDAVEFDTSAIRAAPSAEHLFGTDKLGRDVYTRTLLGGRIALLVTIVGTQGWPLHGVGCWGLRLHIWAAL